MNHGALLLATVTFGSAACGRGVRPSAHEGDAVEASAARDAGPSDATATKTARDLCPETVRHLEEDCLRGPLPATLASSVEDNGYLVVHPRPHDFVYGRVELTVRLDAGVVVASARQEQPWHSNYGAMTGFARRRMLDYIAWCMRENVGDEWPEPSGLFDDRYADGTEDAGESRTVTVSIEALRERLLPESPSCLEEQAKAGVPAPPEAARVFRVMRIENCSGTKIDVYLGDGVPTRQMRWVGSTIEPGTPAELPLPDGARGRVLLRFANRRHEHLHVWWRRGRAVAQSQTDDDTPALYGAEVDTVGDVCDVKVGAADNLSVTATGTRVDSCPGKGHTRIVSPSSSTPRPQP